MASEGLPSVDKMICFWVGRQPSGPQRDLLALKAAQPEHPDLSFRSVSRSHEIIRGRDLETRVERLLDSHVAVPLLMLAGITDAGSPSRPVMDLATVTLMDAILKAKYGVNRRSRSGQVLYKAFVSDWGNFVAALVVDRPVNITGYTFNQQTPLVSLFKVADDQKLASILLGLEVPSSRPPRRSGRPTIWARIREAFFGKASEEKVTCTKCGALILRQTSKKYGGLCAPCGKGQRGPTSA